MSVKIEQFLAKLQEEKGKFADTTLRSPSGKSEFDFGLSCGIYRGLLTAEQWLNELLGENESDKLDASRRDI